jgi:hypothetical protein
MAIHAATAQNHGLIVAQFIACERVDVNAVLQDKRTAVFIAAALCLDAIIAQFVACERADIDAPDENNFTPILVAAGQGHASITDTLAVAGAILFTSDSRLSLHAFATSIANPASPEKKAAILAALTKHGVTSSKLLFGFQSRYYFNDGRGEFYIKRVKYQRWINRKELVLCLHYVYHWSLANQVEEEVHRTLPSDLSKLGHFIAHCSFDVAGGNYGNGIARLIT